jgi:hypothetical protein
MTKRRKTAPDFMNWLIGISRCRPAFLWSASIFLLATAAVKLISVSVGEIHILAQRDPVVWFLPNRQVLLLVAALEILVAGALIFDRLSYFVKTALAAWLFTLFLSYRVGLWALGEQQACKCLGNAAAWLNINPKILDVSMGVFLGFFLVISYLLLFLRSPNDPRSTQRKEDLQKVINKDFTCSM